MKNLEYYKKTFNIGVVLYIIWLLVFYTSFNTRNEYTEFHYDNLKKMCEFNYDKLHRDVQPYCNNFN